MRTVTVSMLFLATIYVVSAAKLSTMMSSNTFIQSSESPTDSGQFVVWNDQAWHYSNDNRLRMWQRSTLTWKDVSTSVFGLIPSLRRDAGFAVACDRFFLYGGYDANGKVLPLSDNFYSFDPARSFSWSKLDYTIGGTIPYARESFGFVGSGTKLYLFGGLTAWPSNCSTVANCEGCLLAYNGANKMCMRNDLYEYNPESGIWKALNQTSGAKPCERMEFAFTAGQGKLFVLGGTTFRTNVPGIIGIARWTNMNSCGSTTGLNFNYRIQDLWSYDLASNLWSALTAPVSSVGILPGLAFHGSVLYAMGGYNGKTSFQSFSYPAIHLIEA
jgi:N-acetylneuraminic acid mutarotase